MSYNGSGTFNINSAGQPVVTGTVIASTPFNALTADLGTGLSTAITKDGQTTTTARIPFAAGINSSLVTDATNTATGSIITAGGVGVAKALFVGTTANIAGTTTFGVTGAAFPGSTSGTATIVVSAAAGTPTLTLPTTTGTLSINGPAFSAYQSSAQTISSSTATKISFQSELFDTANAFDSTTNYRFTPLIAGYYQVTGALYANGITSVQAYIYKNGVNYQSSPYASQNGQFISGLVYLNGSTDYVEMYVFFLVGQVVTAAKEQTYFQAAMVRSA